MLEEPHYPSKWTAAAVLFIILLMIGGVFAWAFWLNTGEITFKADRPFTVEVNGETIDCLAECSVTLPPRTYTIIASATGSYDESFGIELKRWNNLEKTVDFRVIPFLKTLSTAELPPITTPTIHFSTTTRGSLVRDNNGREELITNFESLKDPQVQVVGDIGIVTDQGRVFFVSILDGRKLQRFDDSVVVQKALMSDNGKKILFFVNTAGVDQLWLWYNDTQELTPLTWYAPPEFVQWEPGIDYRLFVISDTLIPTLQTSVLDQVLSSVDSAQQKKLLLQVNLDSAEIVQLATFEDTNVPTTLQRRGDRYLIEYVGGTFDELVVR